jgi:drug/metabolite transporter (DMT)-like permease
MTRSILMVLAGACSFGILSTFVKLAYRDGYSAAQISFLQALLGMGVLWLLVLLRPAPRTPACTGRRPAYVPVLLTGAAIGLTTFVYYVSVRYIPASLAIVLLMQFTWMGMLLDWVVGRRRPTRVQLLASALTGAGTVLASGLAETPWAAVSLPGVGYALLSALLYAVYVVASSRTGSGLPRLTQSALLMTGSAAGIGLVNARTLLAEGSYDLPLLRWVAFLALFGTILPPVLFARGIPRVGAGLSALLMTAELPVAVVCSHLVLAEPVAPVQWLGVGVMLTAMALLHTRNKTGRERPGNGA